MTTTPPKATADDADKASQAALATVLASGITLATAALGAVGGLTGSVARMARNWDGWTALCLCLVVASVVLALASRVSVKTITFQSGITINTAFLIASLALFAIGTTGSIIVLTQSLARDDQPSVNVNVTVKDNVSTISGSASAAGLRANERLYVDITKSDTDKRIYHAATGANQDGQASHEFSVRLPSDWTAAVVTASRESDSTLCGIDENGDEGDACVTVHLP